MSADFAPESPLSREKVLFAIFNLLFEIRPTIRFFKTFQRRSHCHCATVVYFTLLPVSDHLLSHLNVSSLPFLLLNNNYSTKDQHEFPPFSISFSHSGSVRSSFGIRRIVIPRLHKNQNAWTSPVPIPTKIRPRGLMARKTRAQHKVIL